MSDSEGQETIDKVIEFLDDSHLSCKLIFGTKDDDKFVLHHMSLDRDAISGYREVFLRKAKKRKKMKHSEYNSSDYDPKEYMTLKISEVSKAREVLKDSNNKINKLTREFVSQVEFTVFRFQNPELETAYFIRSYWRVELLSQGRLNALIATNGILSIADKDIVIGTPTFEVIGFGDELLIFGKSAFEKIFQYTDSYIMHAKEVFSYLDTNTDYTIVGLKTIEAGCTRLEDLRRISSIRKSNSHQTTKLEKLVAFADRNKELGIVIDQEKRTVNFPDVRSFMITFNEDYHEGPLSGRKSIISRKKLV
jgi:Kiwa KwaB-like protein